MIFQTINFPPIHTSNSFINKKFLKILVFYCHCISVKLSVDNLDFYVPCPKLLKNIYKNEKKTVN